MNLIMVIHCHQPVGNFDHVFDMAHDKCYRPLLDLIEAYPEVKVGLHFSGPLLEWLEKRRSGALELMAGLVERGQVEPLSGGFFEPLLASIPVRDARGQLLMMNDYLENRFGFKPRGFWLTERVWDPSLPLTLTGTGMEYTVVDDTHFYYAGLRPDQIYGRYVTEKEGHTLSLLATPMTMRYMIPFKPVEEVLGHLKGLEEAGHHVALYGDDGEKFGLWPGTYEWVIEKGWLNRFFASITDNRKWLKTILPGEFATSSPSLGRIYLPQASYEEMTEWALPPEQGRALEEIISSLKDQGQWDAWRPFVRGGVWDNFLVKYDEANRMHKKMLFLGERIGGDDEARDYLWRAQCNCAYWHGVFGGLYLGHLRRAVHENLIKAQALLMEKSVDDLQLLRLDFDKDGAEEILISNRRLSFGLDPNRGGGLFDICHLGRALNLSDTLTRRPEAYHRHLNEARHDGGAGGEGIASIHDLGGAGDEDLAGLLVFDRYTKASLLDHFLGSEVTPESYAANEYQESGDFLQGRYRVEKASVSSGEALIEMRRKGRVDGFDLGVTKKIRAGKDARVVVDYLFECRGDEPISTRYACEFNLTLYSDEDQERYYRIPETGGRRDVPEIGKEENLTRFELVNGPDRLSALFSLSMPVSVWFFPLMTVSKSEEGFERTYQGSSLLFLHPLNLAPGQETRFQIQLELNGI
jgi:4-alpha-glucanotransferase